MDLGSAPGSQRRGALLSRRRQTQGIGIDANICVRRETPTVRLRSRESQQQHGRLPSTNTMRDDPHLLELRETIRGPPVQPSKQSIEDDKRPNGRSNHRYGATFGEMCGPWRGRVAARNARHNKARGRWIGAGLAARLNHSSGIEASGLVRQGALSIFGRGAVQQPLKLPEIPVPDLISPRLGKKTNQFCEICVMAAVDEHGRPTERIRKCYYCPVVCHDRCCQAKG